MENIKCSFEIGKDDFERAGVASSQIKKILRQLGLNSGIIRRVSIAAYEAEINIVIHSNGGSIDVEIDLDEVKLCIKDKGPGIENLELAMKEGFSTATEKVREMGFGAGMGLPNMKRCADKFSIESTVGVGTTIVMKMFLKDGV